MNTEIVNWQEKLAADARAIAALERPSVASFSTKAGVLSYGSQPVPGNKLEAVVVASIFERRYYKDRYDPNVLSSPACFALSLDGLAMAPHADSPDPQHTACDSCPLNQWGSDPNGKGKACKEVRRLVLVPKAALADGAKVEMALLTVPVTSVRNWSNYVNAVAASERRPPWGVLTSISLHPDAKTQFRMEFATAAPLSDEGLSRVAGLLDQATAIGLTPYAKRESAPQDAPAPEKGGKRKY